MMSLHCLVYVSLATKDMQDKELRGMLKAARAKNERLGVTGMLLYRDGFFIQALEGEEETIDTLFARIAIDPRHRDVTLVYKKPIPQRGFPDWTMGFSRMTEGELEKMDGYHCCPDIYVNKSNWLGIWLSSTWGSIPATN